MTSATDTPKVIHVDSLGVPIDETTELIKALWLICGIRPEHSARPIIEVIERLIVEHKETIR